MQTLKSLHSFFLYRIFFTGFVLLCLSCNLKNPDLKDLSKLIQLHKTTTNDLFNFKPL